MSRSVLRQRQNRFFSNSMGKISGFKMSLAEPRNGDASWSIVGQGGLQSKLTSVRHVHHNNAPATSGLISGPFRHSDFEGNDSPSSADSESKCGFARGSAWPRKSRSGRVPARVSARDFPIPGRDDFVPGRHPALERLIPGRGPARDAIFSARLSHGGNRIESGLES